MTNTKDGKTNIDLAIELASQFAKSINTAFKPPGIPDVGAYLIDSGGLQPGPTTLPHEPRQRGPLPATSQPATAPTEPATNPADKKP